MAANTIHVDIVSAEGEIFSRRGVHGVRAGARRASSASRRAMRRCSRCSRPVKCACRLPMAPSSHFFVGGGALEIQPNKVTVLADTALRAQGSR